MNILGINNGGESGACLFKGSKLICAVNEERLSRIKLDDRFPIKSINWCLKFSNLKAYEIDVVCYGFTNVNKQTYLETQLINRINSYDEKEKKFIKERLKIEKKVDLNKKNIFLKYCKKKFTNSKIHLVDHHESHKNVAFYSSNYSKAIVVTADGRGDKKSLTFSIFDKNKKKNIEVFTNYSWESLGYLYGRITNLCGFTANRHEGKVTGLAAHGNINKTKNFYKKIVSFNKNKIKFKLGNYYKPFFSNYSSVLRKEAKKYKIEDLSAGVQDILEKSICKIIYNISSKYKINKVCLAGGIFANVKLNQKILELNNISNVNIFPNMTDGGLCVGACIDYIKSKYKSNNLFSNNMYLGPDLNQEILIHKAKKYKLYVYKPKNIIHDTANLIIQKKIIGLVQGRTEFGPRALCNRSIICLANDSNLTKSLNDRLSRNDFMPFAPIISKELANKCLQNFKSFYNSSRFMTITFKVKNIFKKKCPAVVHVDNTVRPQIISKEDNLFAHKLLTHMFNKFGVLSLVNTSFNLHEEPIVNSEYDILRSFKKNAADYLVTNKYIISKKPINK